jgi:hypothetical protein
MKHNIKKWLHKTKAGGWNWSYRFKCKDCGGEYHVLGFKCSNGINELEESTECKCCGSTNTESLDLGFVEDTLKH